MAEAKRLGINTIGMVDSNCDPNKVDFAIPSNDDATKSIAIITNYITAAIAEGLQERQNSKDEEEQHETEETAAARASRFEQKDWASRFEQKDSDGDDKGKRARSGTGTKRRFPSAGGGGRKPAAK